MSLKYGYCCKERCLATRRYSRGGKLVVVEYCVNKGCGAHAAYALQPQNNTPTKQIAEAEVIESMIGHTTSDTGSPLFTAIK